MDPILADIGLVIIVATIVGYVAKFFKQPMILAYIIAGLLLGPYATGNILPGKIVSQETIFALSELGITFLLFIVGLEFNLKKLKEVSNVVFIGGLIQAASISFLGWAIGLWLGFTFLEAIYIGLILSLSSTLIVVKWLSDKKQIDSIHGRIIIGFLIIQDFIAILALTFLGSLNELSFITIVIAAVKGIVLFLTAYIATYPLQYLFNFASRYYELLFISALSLCFVFAFFAQYLGFSIAIGAFLAGIMIGNLPYSVDLIGKIKSLATFFTVLFFVSLGLQLALSSLGNILFEFIVLLLVILLVKPLITMILVKLFNYRNKTSFICGFSLGQISEFSLIIAVLGLKQGHISQELFSMTVLLTVMTMAITPYFMKYDNVIFYKCGKFLFFWTKFIKEEEEDKNKEKKISSQVIIFGYEGVDQSLIEKFKEMKKEIVVVDIDPDVIKRLRAVGLKCIYGDPSEFEIINRLELSKSEVVISTIPDVLSTLYLIKRIRKVNSKTVIIATAQRIRDSLELYDSGADYVVLPKLLGRRQVNVVVENFSEDLSKVLDEKTKHIEELKKRHEVSKSDGSKQSFMDIDKFIGILRASKKKD
jgi:Kef-type K+ transport system membrane component KefB/Trk K+ transport system NAD-binding subunit